MITLYHVTLESNLFDISKNGVDPHKATGKKAVSWWVKLELVEWALAHVSARWQTPVNKLVVIEHKFNHDDIGIWMLRGVYYCANNASAETIWGYEHFIRPEI